MKASALFSSAHSRPPSLHGVQSVPLARRTQGRVLRDGNDPPAAGVSDHNAFALLLSETCGADSSDGMMKGFVYAMPPCEQIASNWESRSLKNFLRRTTYISLYESLHSMVLQLSQLAGHLLRHTLRTGVSRLPA